MPPYWASFYEQLARRMGDPRTEEGRKWLTERSPLTHADKITRPLLIGQGANDPRVKQAESDQIVEAMKAKNIPVTYVLFPTRATASPARRTTRPSTRSPRTSWPSAWVAAPMVRRM